MRKRKSARRGRPQGNDSKTDFELFEYIFQIAIKHGIDSEKLFENIIRAWKHKESTYENLKIVSRKRTIDNSLSFLFTYDNKVVAQFPIPQHILAEPNQLRKFTPMKSLMNHLVKEKVKVKMEQLRMEDLKVGMKKVNMKARVLEISKGKMVFTRFGTSAMVANVLIGDETGTIKLPLWNDQIKTVSIDDVIQIENAHVSAFRGDLQLRIGKRGKLIVIQDTEFPDINHIKIEPFDEKKI